MYAQYQTTTPRGGLNRHEFVLIRSTVKQLRYWVTVEMSRAGGIGRYPSDDECVAYLAAAERVEGELCDKLEMAQNAKLNRDRHIMDTVTTVSVDFGSVTWQVHIEGRTFWTWSEFDREVGLVLDRLRLAPAA